MVSCVRRCCRRYRGYAGRQACFQTSSGNRYSLRSNSHDLCHSKISRYHGFQTGQIARQETAGAGYSQRRYRRRFLLRTVLSWRNSLYRNEILRAEQARQWGGISWFLCRFHRTLLHIQVFVGGYIRSLGILSKGRSCGQTVNGHFLFPVRNFVQYHTVCILVRQKNQALHRQSRSLL